MNEALESKPSKNEEEYWIGDVVESDYPEHTERGGKWLIFVRFEELDDWWKKIKSLLHENKLGASAKTATAKPNPNANDPKYKVICVYAYDADDKDDVMRIRESLRTIGVTWKIPFKLDSDTFLGRYRKKGDKRVSAYYE